MSLCMPFRGTRATCNFRSAVFPFLVQSGHSASFPPRQEQEAPRQRQEQSSQSQQQSPKPQQSTLQPSNSPTSQHSEPKRKKVWTNDDVIPCARQQTIIWSEKEAQEAAAGEAAAREASEAKQIKEAGLTEKLPATVEETQKLIAVKEIQITEDQEALDAVHS